MDALKGEIMSRIINNFDAVCSLVGANIAGTQKEDGSWEFYYQDDQTQPSEAEIDAEVIRLQAEYDAQEYARNRASAYDSVGDQLDQLMKDMRDGTTTHKDACEAVKAKFPKPE